MALYTSREIRRIVCLMAALLLLLAGSVSAQEAKLQLISDDGLSAIYFDTGKVALKDDGTLDTVMYTRLNMGQEGEKVIIASHLIFSADGRFIISEDTSTFINGQTDPGSDTHTKEHQPVAEGSDLEAAYHIMMDYVRQHTP